MIDITFVTDCLCLCIRARKNIIIIIIMNTILFELHSSYPEQILDFFLHLMLAYMEVIMPLIDDISSKIPHLIMVI